MNQQNTIIISREDLGEFNDLVFTDQQWDRFSLCLGQRINPVIQEFAKEIINE